MAGLLHIIKFAGDFLFTNVFQVAYDHYWLRRPNNTDEAQPGNEIHLSPGMPLWALVIMTLIGFVVIDRFILFGSHFLAHDVDEQWASDILANMCTGNKQYRGRIYSDSCMKAYRIRKSGRILGALEKTASETHSCIWTSCSSLIFDTVTMLPAAFSVTLLVTLIVIFMCFPNIGGTTGARIITYIPAQQPPHHQQQQHLLQPDSQNSVNPEDDPKFFAYKRNQ